MKTIQNNKHGLRQSKWPLCAALAGLVLAASVGISSAAEHIVSSFPNASAVTTGWYYQNWNGSAGSMSFSTNDANGSASSGSMLMTTTFSPTLNGGVYRLGIGGYDASAFAALEFDVKVDAASGLDQYGTAADFKVGVFTTSGYTYHANDLNVGIVTTNGGWRHLKFPASSLGGVEWTNIQEVFIQHYDNNYTNSQTALTYIDNIKFTAADPTYPNVLALTFDNVTNVVTTGTTGWYGNAINTYQWATNDAGGSSPTSGSLHIVADFTSGNNSCVVAIPFDPLYPGFSSPTPDTNIVINAQQAQAVEMDVLWDTANSTVAISDFNSVGDVNGFPLGLLYNSPGGGSGGQSEAFGTSTTALPNAASNGWVHLSFPLNQSSPNIDQCIGLWLKKYQYNSALSGTVGFYIDNVKFIGGIIPKSGPPLSISKPVYGLQQAHITGGYTREGLVTSAANYTFVNQPNMNYSMKIASFPSDSGMSANFMFVPLQVPTVDGTATQPNWVYPNILCAVIERSGTGSSLTLRAKVNQPNSNGSLYDSSTHPAFTTGSKIEGNWSVQFISNTNILVTAPDGSFTNLAFPGAAVVNPTGLTSSDVAANFDFSANMVVYFNSQNGGSATASRVVLASATISQGATTLLTDNFQADSTLNIPATWLLASNGGATVGTFLLDPTIKWYLEWPVTFNGFAVQVNSSLVGSAWSTNPIASNVAGTVYHSDVNVTNLPSGGTAFFRLKK